MPAVVELVVTQRGADIRKQLDRLRKNGQIVAEQRAINTLATWVRGASVKKVASDIRLPRKFVAKRFSRSGQVKADRVILRKARKQRDPEAKLRSWMRGLPVYQIATSTTKAGVKGRGGRFYGGAFVPASQRGPGRKVPTGALVFKRRGPGSRARLMLPKLGLRERLDDELRDLPVSAEGQRRMRTEFNRQLNLAIRRLR